jgi:flagellar basal body-associated protein FliL
MKSFPEKGERTLLILLLVLFVLVLIAGAGGTYYYLAVIKKPKVTVTEKTLTPDEQAVRRQTQNAKTYSQISGNVIATSATSISVKTSSATKQLKVTDKTIFMTYSPTDALGKKITINEIKTGSIVNAQYNIKSNEASTIWLQV